jgi:hypothetical protein
MKTLYKAKDYPDFWIKKQVRKIEIRNELTDEGEKRSLN